MALIDGLYYIHIFQMKASTYEGTYINHVVVKTILASALWHFRLGHLSNKPLSLLGSQFSFVQCNNDHICDTCHLVK